MKSPFKNPICVALDVDSAQQALALVDQLSPIVGGFKVGPRLCLRYGEKLIEQIAKKGPVFVDNKHFDIPSTMLAAVKASYESGASLVTVHALSGSEALVSLAEWEAQITQKHFFKILSVTVLTSWDESSLPASLQCWPVREHVLSLSQEVLKSGLTGLVCSAHELELLQGRGHYLVTPGIRFVKELGSDQKRTMGPAEAVKAGSNLLVVGRPIIEASNPELAAADFVNSVI
ncbi:MAG: orotidine-5'-phosphate decarboxylase [Bdellovibrionia bacterium]